MKTRVAEEAEESTTMINGSKGIIARCVAHLEHSLDGKQSCGQPTMEGIGPPPCIYALVVSYGSKVKGKRW